jgi:hypothetical protein
MSNGGNYFPNRGLFNFLYDNQNNFIIADFFDPIGVMRVNNIGINVNYFSGRYTTTMTKDRHDNVYVFSWTTDQSGGILSPRIDVISSAGSVSNFCAGCIPPGSLSNGVIDSKGNYFSIGTNGRSIIKMTPSLGVTTFAGIMDGSSLCNDGVGMAAHFKTITHLEIDANDNLYALDVTIAGGPAGCNKIRKISPDGTVSTVYSFSDSNSSAGGVNGIAVDKSGNIFYSMYTGFSATSGIMRISSSGLATRFCGGAADPGPNVVFSGGSCNSSLYPAGMLGFNADGDLLIYAIDANHQPNLYMFARITR